MVVNRGSGRGCCRVLIGCITASLGADGNDPIKHHNERAEFQMGMSYLSQSSRICQKGWDIMHK